MSNTTQWIERQIVALTVQTLLNAGKSLSIDPTNDCSGELEPIKDISDASMDSLMAAGEECLFVGDRAWVRFIYGNGWDVISDYSVGLEEVLDPILTLSGNQDMDELTSARAKLICT